MTYCPGKGVVVAAASTDTLLSLRRVVVVNTAGVEF
jgi:hypothetical protein